LSRRASFSTSAAIPLRSMICRALRCSAYGLVHGDGVVTTDTEHGRKAIRFTPVLQSGNETLLHYACLDGMGFAFLPKWLVSDDLAAGRLERVLPEKLFFAGRLLAVYPSRNISRSRCAASSTSLRTIRA
jgi:DNA-binding transcriptional LysR family regulator